MSIFFFYLSSIEIIYIKKYNYDESISKYNILNELIFQFK